MGQQDSNTGEKTEKATAKKLEDARKQGNVTRSKDLSQTVTMLAWGLLFVSLGGYFTNHLSMLLELTWTNSSQVTLQSMANAGMVAFKTLCVLTIAPIGLVSAVGALTEFLQTGPVFSIDPVKPKFEHLDLSKGLKRIFSFDNVFEVFKSIFKTLVIFIIVIAVILINIDDVLMLPNGSLPEYMAVEHALLLSITTWVVVAFLFLSIPDWLYQKFSYLKKLRMSKYDIKKERKDQEGDPQLKNARRRLQRQWALQNAQKNVRAASALVVNPTHIAVALYYSPEETLVPVVSAKGEGNLAKLMRQTALDEGVPIVKNIPLARALNFKSEEEEFIPEELFQAVAEVLAWAQRVKQQSDAKHGSTLYKEVP